MSMNKKINRRDFLRLSAMTVGGMALAACAPEATQAPVQEAPVAEATQPPAAAATPTPRPVAEPTNTPVPTVAAAKESPLLADMVAAGTLPPLADRLPKNPLTLQPVNGTGKFGGRLKMASWWQDGGIAAKLYGHSFIRFVDDGLGLAPGIVESWEANADNTVWTFNFREGLKWSDGAPCTTADVLYWWEDMVLDPNHPALPPSEFSAVEGVLPEFVALDDYTLEIRYVKPAPLTAKRLAMWVNGTIGPRMIAPAEFAKQFNPKYNSAYANFEDHDRQINSQNNPDCPTLNSWMLTAYEQGVSSTYERNPYYYCVDSEGNQLPYIDGIDDKPSPDAQYLQLQILQGSVEYEVHTYQLTLGDIASLKEGEERGNYEIRFWDTGSGTGMMYFWNYDSPDEKKRELFRNPTFKKAISHAIDRPTIQRIVYYDTGILTTGTMSPKAIEFNFNAEAQAHYEKFRSLAVDYDPEKAKTMLDDIGVVDVDGDGFREFPDGSKFEFRIDIGADAAGESIKVMEITQKNWKDIGFNVIINSIPPSDFGPSWRAGKLDFRTAWEVGDGPDHLLYPSWVVPDETERWAPLCGQLRIVKGTELENSEADVSPWDRQPPRFNVNDPQYVGTPIERLHQLYDQAIFEVDDIKRMELVWQMNEIHMTDGPFFLGTVCNTPRIIVVSKNLDNVPTREQLKLGGFCNPWIIPTPAVTNPETMSFKNV
jgi:peptide/nickel transport system substrate-binding protein